MLSEEFTIEVIIADSSDWLSSVVLSFTFILLLMMEFIRFSWEVVDKEFTISILDKRFWDLTKENDNFGFGVFAKVKYDCLLVRDSCLRMREENKDDKEGITFWMKKLIWVNSNH